MLFPWIGLLEQVRLADIFVHYDDVQFSKGSLVNRVQIKTSNGMRWMTVPLRDVHLGQKIDEAKTAPFAEWRDHHFDLLERSFSHAPYLQDALTLAHRVYAVEYPNIGALARASLLAMVDYFALKLRTQFVDVKELGIGGSGSARVLEVAKHLGADTYITGHGAAHYLRHEEFACAGVNVCYMQYSKVPYPQLHGEFSPYVSGLDLIANCGRDGIRYICSETVNWRAFINDQAR